MNTRFLLGMGLAFVLVLGAGIAAVIGVTSATERASTTVAPSADKIAAQPPSVAPSSGAVTPPAAGSAQPSVATTAPLCPASASPSTPITVQRSDIDNLAAAVNLNGPVVGDVGKDVWMREVPIAQKLLTGICDCDQRNWLKHYISTGQEAMSGSSDYVQSVQLLATLRRSNHPPLTSNP